VNVDHDDDRAVPVEYVRARVAEALATDPRTAELGIAVVELGGALVLTGVVSSPERRHAAAAVAASVAPDREVRNDLSVMDLTPPTTVDAM
jgi:osmotically-inducible protein OsmY